MKIPQTTSISLLLFFIVTASQHLCRAQNSPQDFLDAHNAARAEVGVGPMTWDANVAAFSQNYVNSRLDDCSLQHSKNIPYGENIASGQKTGVDAMNEWVAEKVYYDYGSNSCVGGPCGHYTQVVWRDSVRLGCAMAQCNGVSVWYIACHYDPKGNIGGQRRPYSVINLSVASTSYAKE